MTSEFDNLRVRIAPSPTGDPHVGTAYVALFNMVLARKHKGSFVLRIEDTDQSRARQGSERMIMDTLTWLGISWDEGPDKGGPYGPYRQSERREIYQTHVQELVDKGHAYRCFCTPERLSALRDDQRSQGLTTKYDRHCLTLSREEIDRRVLAGEASVVRLRIPDRPSITFVDQLRGEVEINVAQIDDQVLLKSDGMPTYHLANVVDDYLMKISHVMRAEEWISSTPKHVILYECFGWQQPKWIHLPLLRNSDRSKISKRKNPVSLAYYRRAGILPEALRNFLGLMGWSLGDDKEIFALEQMIEAFNYQDFHLGGPVFDIDKLNWLNQQYMHRMDAQQFADYLRNEVFGEEFLKRLHGVALERMSRFEQFVDKNNFFFNGALDYQGLTVVPQGKEAKEFKTMVLGVAEMVDAMDEWSAAKIQEALDKYRQQLGWKPKDFFMPLRLILTGRKDSPPLPESLEMIGREMVRFRLRDYVQREA